MNPAIQFKVSRAENGLTLQQFLAGRLARSRNAAKGLIDQRRIFVNDRRVWMARHGLRGGDIVSGVFQPENQPAIGRGAILYEDRDYLIADKPAGILSNGPASLEAELIKLSGNCALAAGHRLDKDTSGCLVFAKHAAAKKRLVELFARNQVQKKYAAITRGRMAAKALTITRPIAGQSARTAVRLIDATPAASHLALTIATGRTHQIRIHLAALGHPLLGDRQYGVDRAVTPLEKSIPRQMLHAAEIKFFQPFTGQPVAGRANLPADFRTALKKYHLKQEFGRPP